MRRAQRLLGVHADDERSVSQRVLEHVLRDRRDAHHAAAHGGRKSSAASADLRRRASESAPIENVDARRKRRRRRMMRFWKSTLRARGRRGRARVIGERRRVACSMALDTSGNISTNAAPPVIYVTGSSALKPLIAALAPSMFLDTNRPTTIVYVSQGSCTGVSRDRRGRASCTANTTACVLGCEQQDRRERQRPPTKKKHATSGWRRRPPTSARPTSFRRRAASGSKVFRRASKNSKARFNR